MIGGSTAIVPISAREYIAGIVCLLLLLPISENGMGTGLKSIEVIVSLLPSSSSLFVFSFFACRRLRFLDGILPSSC